MTPLDNQEGVTCVEIYPTNFYLSLAKNWEIHTTNANLEKKKKESSSHFAPKFALDRGTLKMRGTTE